MGGERSFKLYVPWDNVMCTLLSGYKMLSRSCFVDVRCWVWMERWTLVVPIYV